LRATAPAAMIADAVLLPISVIGVTGAKRVGDRRVVLASCVLVSNQERDRRTGRRAFEYAGKDFDGVGFAALRDMPRCAGFAPVEIVLDVGDGQCHARRAAVDDAPDRRSVRLAERGDAKKPAEGVSGHRLSRDVDVRPV
jgi:hypothetical protein